MIRYSSTVVIVAGEGKTHIRPTLGNNVTWSASPRRVFCNQTRTVSRDYRLSEYIAHIPTTAILSTRVIDDRLKSDLVEMLPSGFGARVDRKYPGPRVNAMSCSLSVMPQGAIS